MNNKITISFEGNTVCNDCGIKDVEGYIIFDMNAGERLHYCDNCFNHLNSLNEH